MTEDTGSMDMEAPRVKEDIRGPIRQESAMFVTLALLFGFAMIEARNLAPDARIFPYLVGALGLFFSLGSLAQLLVHRDKLVRGSYEDYQVESADLQKSPRAFWLWFLGFCAITWVLGFYVGLPIMAGAYTFFARAGWRRGLVPGLCVGVGTWFYLYVVFAQLLEVPWFSGTAFQ